LVAALPLGLAIGLTLGAVGGGGAVLAVPLLVYVLGQDVHAATTTSLVVVAAAAIAGGSVQAGRARVCWRQVSVFAPAVLAGSLAGTLANEAVSGSVILLSFAPVLFAAAWFTWRRASSGEGDDEGCPPSEPGRALVTGLSVGTLTGFFGVGGGFLVVPMLALVMRFPLRRAMATSLVVIGFASVAALAGHVWRSGELDAGLTIAMAFGCVVGAVAGTNLADRLPKRRLARGFALLVAAAGAYVLFEATLP
jgi:uncharacterized membrane protein YfcA